MRYCNVVEEGDCGVEWMGLSSIWDGAYIGDGLGRTLLEGDPMEGLVKVDSVLTGDHILGAALLLGRHG